MQDIYDIFFTFGDFFPFFLTKINLPLHIPTFLRRLGAMFLAGDIGGTKTNLAIFVYDDSLDKLVPTKIAAYPSRDHTSLADIIREFLGGHAEVRNACFGSRQGRPG
jgi:hypothetical protein